MDLIKRKVMMFRCHLDPGVGPTPKNAFMVTDVNSPIEDAELTPGGVYVKMKPVRDAKDGAFVEHLIPYANIQSIKLMPEKLEEKRGPGRPKAES